MSKSAIGWTDESWNCIRGCTEVSPGCAHCYAREQAARIMRMDAPRIASSVSVFAPRACPGRSCRRQRLQVERELGRVEPARG